MRIYVMTAGLALAALSFLVWLIPSGWQRKPETETALVLLTHNGKEVAPDSVASLRVVTWDVTAKCARPFELARKSERWVIPSHYDYPSDAGSRVGSTAGGVLNVRRGPLFTSNPALHAELGVIDPMQEYDPVREKESAAEARGKRVTLKDAGGQVLVDLVVGRSAEGPNNHYVRLAAQNEVYTASLNVDISTEFRDWVETDLLKLWSGDLRSVAILDYSVDDARGVVKERARTAFSRPSSDKDWTSEQTPAGKVVNQDSLRKLLDEATGMRISGIRPYHPNWLEHRGFFVERDNLYGKEGCLVLGSREGISYHLFFGHVAFLDQEDVAPDPKAAPKKSGPQDAAKSAGQNRYLAVFVSYDEKADESKPKDEPKKEGAKAEDKPKEPPPSQKKAEKAQQRFFKFFYVISDETFKKLRPPLADLFKVPEPPKTDAPKTDAPKTDAPKTDAPKTDAPKTDAPKTKSPKIKTLETKAPKK